MDTTTTLIHPELHGGYETPWTEIVAGDWSPVPIGLVAELLDGNDPSVKTRLDDGTEAFCSPADERGVVVAFRKAQARRGRCFEAMLIATRDLP